MDNGLLLGLSQGLNAGLDNFMAVQKAKKDQDEKKRSQQLLERKQKEEEMSKGLIYDEASGKVMKDPALEAAASPEEMARAQGLMKTYGIQLPEDVGLKHGEAGEFTKKLLTGLPSFAEKKEATKAAGVYRNAMLGTRQGTQAAKSVQDLQKEVGPFKTQIDTAEKGLGVLRDTKSPLTPQRLAGVQTEIAKVMRGPGAVNMSEEQREMFHSVSEKIASLQQQYSGKPIDLRKSIPDIIKSLDDTLEHLAAATNEDIAARTEMGYNEGLQAYASNPKAKAALQTFYDQHKDYRGFKRGRAGKAATQPTGLVGAPSGKVAVSNGKETLYIDSDDLDAAQKDGYKQVGK